jgi:hypothetical protein
LIWFHVSFDENTVFLDVNPPGGEGWKDQFQWGEIIRRDLFDAELAIKIASATEGLYCWPED